MDTAGGWSDMFRFCPWVFSTVHRANGIDFAYGFTLGIKSKPWADIREFAAGTTTKTLAPAGF